MRTLAGLELSRPRPLLCLSLFFHFLVPGAGIKQDLVMMILFDGFRHDYFSLANTPNFNTMRKDGVYAERLKPVFPSVTFPNNHAISTGLYTEAHGIIANTILDPKTRKRVFMFTDGEYIATADPRIIPIWVRYA